MEVRFWKGKAFLGCSNYPNCRETIDFPEGVEYVYQGKRVLVSRSLQAYHKQREKEREKAEGEGEGPRRTCPNCGAAMELREGRFGRFYGCSRYPECKTTEPVSTGVPCPLCGQDLVERYAKSKRKVFYGCQGYPECDFAVNRRPIRLCPKCDSGVLLERGGDELICSNKQCGHREPQQAS